MPISRLPPAADLTTLARHVRSDDAALRRARERHLRLAATTDATTTGAMLDWAERGEALTIRTVAGRLVHGRVSFVAGDAVGIGRAWDVEGGDRLGGAVGVGAGITLVPLRAIAVVRVDGPARDVSGTRAAPRPITFATLIGDLAASRAVVSIAVAGEPLLLAGQLRSASAEVLTLRLPGRHPVIAVIGLDQLSELTVLASG